MAQQKTDSSLYGQQRAASSTQRNQNRSTARNESKSEQIARRAYEIFLSRGGEHGRDQEDWFQAEDELRLSSN